MCLFFEQLTRELSLIVLCCAHVAVRQRRGSRELSDADDRQPGPGPSRPAPASSSGRPRSAVQLMVDAKLAQFGYTSPPDESDVPIGERHHLPAHC